jgi:hypothetical protein
MFVYLCGPMTENTPEQADGWRQEAKEFLRKAGFNISSPMREKGMLTKAERMGMTYDKYGDVPELRAQSILARDQFDVRHADILLANMIELGVAYRHEKIGFYEDEVQIPSIGSDWEMQLAYELRIPIVLIAPPGNPYAEHPFLRGASNIIRFDTMQPGLDWIERNLGLYA